MACVGPEQVDVQDVASETSSKQQIGAAVFAVQSAGVRHSVNVPMRLEHCC
jgi:hypothetical protein